MDDFAFINNTFAKNAIFYINRKNTNSWLDEKATLANGHDVDGKETNQVLYKDTALYKTYFRDCDNGDYTLTKEGYAASRQHIPDFPDINREAIGYAPVTNAAPLAQDVKIITCLLYTSMSPFPGVGRLRIPTCSNLLRNWCFFLHYPTHQRSILTRHTS